MRYAFEDCVLDTDRRELRRAGKPIKIEPKVYQVLVYLVQQSERVVSQDELLEHVWPGTYVQPIAVARSITAIRKAVGDHRAIQQVIQTLPRHGYRFVAPVTVLDTTWPVTEPWFPLSEPTEPSLSEPAPNATTTPWREFLRQPLQASAELQERLQEEHPAPLEQGPPAAQQRQVWVQERVVGPVPSAVVAYFKDREEALRVLHEQLATEQLRLLLICGRGGIGKTALITKFLHELQQNFTLHTGAASVTLDSIVYVSLRLSEFRSPDKIVELIGRTLEPDAAAVLQSKWQEQAPLVDKFDFLLRRLLGTRRYLIVLDNFEDVLDLDNHIRDEFEDLRHFIEICLEWDHGVRLLVTSRQTLVLSPALEGHIGARRVELRLDEGLPEADGVALLRELDMDGSLGLQTASDDILRSLVRRCDGLPRTLETLVGTLRQHRTWTLTRLLAETEVLTRLLDNPAQELYTSLSPQEQQVMQVLAVYDRPVPVAAVCALLPGLPVGDLLDALVRNYAVTYDRERFTLHSLDQHYAYRQIPDDDGNDARPDLHRRAAAFFRTLRQPQETWKTIEDLEPQLQEVYHLIQGEQYDQACALLNEIDADYLARWGYYASLVEIRSQVMDRLTDPTLQEANWSSLGSLHFYLGHLQQAQACHEQALAVARTRGDHRSESLHSLPDTFINSFSIDI